MPRPRRRKRARHAPPGADRLFVQDDARERERDGPPAARRTARATAVDGATVDVDVAVEAAPLSPDDVDVALALLEVGIIAGRPAALLTFQDGTRAREFDGPPAASLIEAGAVAVLVVAPIAAAATRINAAVVVIVATATAAAATIVVATAAAAATLVTATSIVVVVAAAAARSQRLGEQQRSEPSRDVSAEVGLTRSADRVRAKRLDRRARAVAVGLENTPARSAPRPTPPPRPVKRARANHALRTAATRSAPHDDERDAGAASERWTTSEGKTKWTARRRRERRRRGVGATDDARGEDEMNRAAQARARLAWRRSDGRRPRGR